MKFDIYLSSPHLTGQESKYIQEALDTNWVSPLGPNVDAFEKEVGDYYGGTSQCLALSSGTAAIHLALLALGVGRGDRVLCSSLTFAASANPILYCGAEPVFVDSEPSSWNMSPAALERALGELKGQGIRPKAAVIVGLYGQCADMDVLNQLCDAYGVPVIEDAAEALGSTYRDRKAGALAKVGILSFNGNKIITTSGGGMLVSDDKTLVERCRHLATQARDPAPHYEHTRIGYNYRLSNLLAGVGRAQFAALEERVQRRREIFARYREELGDFAGVGFMPEAAYGRSTRWLTVMVLDPRATEVTPSRVRQALYEDRIEARPVWKPMHLQPVFEKCPYYPHATGRDVGREFFEVGLCLPSGSNMTPSIQGRVIDRVKAVFSR